MCFLLQFTFAFAGVAHLVERDLAKVEVASSSLVARSKKNTIRQDGVFFGMPRAGLNLLPRPARSALNQEVRQGSCEWLCHSWDAGSESSLVARSKRKTPMRGVFLFEQHFCCAKVVACGRVIEREWGNPSEVPPSHSPSLRWAGVQTTKPVDSHKRNTIRQDGVFFLECRGQA